MKFAMIFKRLLDKIFGFDYYQYERLLVLNRKELRKYFDKIKKLDSNSHSDRARKARAISELRRLLSHKFNIEIEVICYHTFISDKGHLNKKYSNEIRILGINLREPDYNNRERLFDLYNNTDFTSYDLAEEDAVDRALRYLAFPDLWDSRYAFGCGKDLLFK